MLWNFLQIEIRPDDRLIVPLAGPGDLTRDQAHAQVQQLLDAHPQLAPIAATWKHGAKDDTVYAGPFVWTIYAHAPGDWRPAALAWVQDYAATLRSTGLDVQVARLPDGQ